MTTNKYRKLKRKTSFNPNIVREIHSISNSWNDSQDYSKHVVNAILDISWRQEGSHERTHGRRDRVRYYEGYIRSFNDTGIKRHMRIRIYVGPTMTFRANHVLVCDES